MKTHLFYLAIVAAVVSYAYYNHQRLQSVGETFQLKERRWIAENDLLKTEVTKLNTNIGVCKDNTEKLHSKSVKELENLKRSYESAESQKSECVSARSQAETNEQQWRQTHDSVAAQLEQTKALLQACNTDKEAYFKQANTNYASYDLCIKQKAQTEADLNGCLGDKQAVDAALEEARAQSYQSAEKETTMFEKMNELQQKVDASENAQLAIQAQLNACAADKQLCDREKLTLLEAAEKAAIKQP